MSDMSERRWQDSRRSPDERARLVVVAMTEDEFSWLSAPMALPIPGRSEVPPGALGSAAYYAAITRLGIPVIAL